MTSAAAQQVVAEIMPLLEQMVQQAVARVGEKTPPIMFLPGYVTSVDGSTIDVRVDSPDDEPPADVQGVWIGATLPSGGDRVMCVQAPPAGLYVLGRVLPG